MKRLTGMLSILATITICTAVVASEQPASDIKLCGFSSSIKFTESAPRDRFSIQNTSLSDWSINTVSLDLSTSAGNLIFDVTAQGAGVEVFQPFRAEAGDATLATEPVVDDGDQSILLQFSTFKPEEVYQFSIDLDDQLIKSELGQIRVSGGEIEGATVTLAITNSDGGEQIVTGQFDETNQAVLPGEQC